MGAVAGAARGGALAAAQPVAVSRSAPGGGAGAASAARASRSFHRSADNPRTFPPRRHDISVTLPPAPGARLVPACRIAPAAPEVAVVDYTSLDVPLATVLWVVVWALVCVAAALVIGVVVLSVCCGIEYLRETGKRVPSSGWLHSALLLAVGLGACAPRFQHLDGSRFRPIAPPQAFDHGWVVLDSCADGPHALVEIELETDDRGLRPRQLDGVAFRLASDDLWPPARMRVDGPFCTPSRAPEPRTIRTDDDGNHLIYRLRQPCTYVVRAQFTLDRLPRPGTLLTVVHGTHVIHLSRR